MQKKIKIIIIIRIKNQKEYSKWQSFQNENLTTIWKYERNRYTKKDFKRPHPGKLFSFSTVFLEL